MASQGIHRLATAIAREGVDTRHQGETLTREEARGLALHGGVEAVASAAAIGAGEEEAPKTNHERRGSGSHSMEGRVLGCGCVDPDEMMATGPCSRCGDPDGSSFFEDDEDLYCTDCYWDERKHKNIMAAHTCPDCEVRLAVHYVKERGERICEQCLDEMLDYRAHCVELEATRELEADDRAEAERLMAAERPPAAVGLPVGAGAGPEWSEEGCVCCGDLDVGPWGRCADCEVALEMLHEEEGLGRG